MRAHPEVGRALREAEEVCLTVIVLGELRAGFLRGSRVRRNEEQLRDFLSQPRVRVLDLDQETSERYAVIRNDLRRRGTPVAANDLWIAASAFQHGLRVLTTDGDFKLIPQVLVHHFEPVG
jgi:tRNA(fMet)-specific endonuclease VapC